MREVISFLPEITLIYCLPYSMWMITMQNSTAIENVLKLWFSSYVGNKVQGNDIFFKTKVFQFFSL